MKNKNCQLYLDRLILAVCVFLFLATGNLYAQETVPIAAPAPVEEAPAAETDEELDTEAIAAALKAPIKRLEASGLEVICIMLKEWDIIDEFKLVSDEDDEQVIFRVEADGVASIIWTDGESLVGGSSWEVEDISRNVVNEWNSENLFVKIYLDGDDLRASYQFDVKGCSIANLHLLAAVCIQQIGEIHEYIQE